MLLWWMSKFSFHQNFRFCYKCGTVVVSLQSTISVLLLAAVSSHMAYQNMLFILELVCTAVSSRINNMLKLPNFGINQTSKLKLQPPDDICILNTMLPNFWYTLTIDGMRLFLSTTMILLIPVYLLYMDMYSTGQGREHIYSINVRNHLCER